MAKRGRPKKVQEVVENGVQEETQEGQTVTTAEVPDVQIVIEKPEPVRFQEKPPQSAEDRIAESRKALLNPLAAGQKYFETPDGEIIIGEAEKNEIWSRRLNAWVNPRR